jgi:hypothetical protein
LRPIEVAVSNKSRAIVLFFLLGAGLFCNVQVWADNPIPEIEFPRELSPEGNNIPVAVDGNPDHYDGNGYPEDLNGLLVTRTESQGYMIYLESILDPFLLYAQFVNRQRDGVFLARSGPIKDPQPNGEMHLIPYGHGSLKTSTSYVSLAEGLLVPHISDNQKEYEQFVIRDLYLALALGVSGLLGELQYAYAEHIFGYANLGVNFLGGVGGSRMAPLNYYRVPLRLGAGLRYTDLLATIIGENHWGFGAEVLLGFGDADQNPQTPSPVWLPGVFFEIEKRDLFGWGNSWTGFSPRGDYREDPRPYNYHVRSVYLRLTMNLNLQSGADTGYVGFDVGVGFRYNVIGPKIPEHEFKETRVVYLNDEYREQIRMQLEKRQQRIEQSTTDN